MDKPVVAGAYREEVTSDAEKSLTGMFLLADQPESTIKELEDVCRWYRYPKGERIFDRSDTRRDVYFIVEGCVRAVDHAQSGQEVAFVDLKASG